jgi:hypothetical protein
MRNDDHLIFEGYKNKRSMMGLHFGMSDAEYNKMEEEREKQEHKQFKKDYMKAVKSGDLKHKSEDEETHCKYAQEGCDCDGCQDCKDNQTKSEDAETYGVEEKIKMALHEVEGFGYTGDGLDCKELAKLVVGSPNDWGDSYGHVVQALEHVLTAYYEKGLQDS